MRKVMDRARLEHEKWTCAACLCKRLECLMLRVPTCVEAWYDLGIGNVRSALPRLHSIQPVGVHPGSNLVVGICDICSHRWRLQCSLWRVENVCDRQVHVALHHLSGRSQIENVIFVFSSSMICDILWLSWTVSEVSDVCSFAWWNTTHEFLNHIYCLYSTVWKTKHLNIKMSCSATENVLYYIYNISFLKLLLVLYCILCTASWLIHFCSKDYWLVYLFPLVYYYGDMKLGKDWSGDKLIWNWWSIAVSVTFLQDDEEPEYGDLTYLAMVWCAGVAIGLIFYGASEPLFHATDGTNRCWADSHLTDVYGVIPKLIHDNPWIHAESCMCYACIYTV